MSAKTLQCLASEIQEESAVRLSLRYCANTHTSNISKPDKFWL